VIVGAEHFDDAGVIDLGNGQALVQTIDFFPPVVDDPFDFGRIAAANSLSDVYAMGATPFSALNVVGFPCKKLDTRVLGDILAGGAAKIGEAGAALLGGHSIDDTEVLYGLAVTGLIRTNRVLTNSRARVGDRIVLTKPLGMGAMSTAAKKAQVDAGDLSTAIETMATLNAGGARAAQRVGVHAVTDVTGFGLMGHAAEMARASCVSIHFSASALPFTPGARRLADRGIVSGGAARSRTSLGGTVVVDPGVSNDIATLAFDAETSGGLLIAVAPDRCDALLQALSACATPCAVNVAVVGRAESEVLVTLDAD
jgi:selenide,water dikinase